MRGQEGRSCRDTALMTALTQCQASGAAGGTFPDLLKGKLSSRKSTGLSPSLCRLVSGVEAPRWEPPQPRCPPGLGATHQQESWEGRRRPGLRERVGAGGSGQGVREAPGMMIASACVRGGEPLSPPLQAKRPAWAPDEPPASTLQW